jgi:hypothetical protein
MSDTITRLRDARVFKKLGKPLNMPVEERTFSKEYTKHWYALNKAHDKFTIAIKNYSDGPRAGSSGAWRLVARHFHTIKKEMQNCDAFVGRQLRGNPAQHECHVMAWFLTERAMPFMSFWESLFDTLMNSDETISFNGADVPRWFDEALEGE